MFSMPRKAFELFWRNPILWVPCFVAAESQMVVGKFERVGIHWLVSRQYSGRSVLGFDTPQPLGYEESVHHAFLIATPALLAADLLIVSLYIAGLLATAHLVAEIEKGARPRIEKAVATVMPRSRSILGFSLLFMVAIGIVPVLVAATINFVNTKEAISRFLQSGLLPNAVGNLFLIPVYWLLSPMALRLLKGDPHANVTPWARKASTIALRRWLSFPVCSSGWRTWRREGSG